MIRGSATLDDDQKPAFPLNLTDGGTWKYTEQYTCSSDKVLYEGDNTYTFDESNTAIVTSGGAEEDRSTASTAVNCYVPTISKTATGHYKKIWGWDVFTTGQTKTGFAGQKVGFQWTIRAKRTAHGEEFAVTGDITIGNPNPEDDLIVTLNDVLDEGTIATIIHHHRLTE